MPIRRDNPHVGLQYLFKAHSGQHLEGDPGAIRANPPPAAGLYMRVPLMQGLFPPM